VLRALRVGAGGHGRDDGAAQGHGGAGHMSPATSEDAIYLKTCLLNRPISVFRLGAMPIQRCGQSVSAPRGKAGAWMNADTELGTTRRVSAQRGKGYTEIGLSRVNDVAGGVWQALVHGASEQAVHDQVRPAAPFQDQGKAVQVDPSKPKVESAWNSSIDTEMC
jgi:hypothetical protein